MALLVEDGFNLDREVGVILSASVEAPDRIQVSVVVCGGVGQPFRAQLLFFGDARLDSPVWLGLDEQANPAYDDRESLQVFSFEIDVVHTICAGEDFEDAGIFGQSATISGLVQRPHTRTFAYGGLTTARMSVALPGLGYIPANSAVVPDFVPSASVSIFGGPYNNLDPSAEAIEADELGLQKPVPVRYQSLVSTSVDQRPELLTQAEEASTGLTSVRWRSTEPITAHARLVDDDKHASHQSQLVLLTMMLGIATSLLAAALWSSFDRVHSPNPGVSSFRRTATGGEDLGRLASIAIVIVLVVAASRRRGKD